jgi:hypothetical protein
VQEFKVKITTNHTKNTNMRFDSSSVREGVPSNRRFVVVKMRIAGGVYAEVDKIHDTR